MRNLLVNIGNGEVDELEGHVIYVDEGNLHVDGDKGEPVAIYAAGCWSSAVFQNGGTA